MSRSRASLSLDGEWSFVRDPQREHRAETLPPGEPIQVPGCWEAQLDQPYGIVTGWYRREFDLPEDWAGQRLVLRFGAVMYACEVYLNAGHVGGHEGGYTPFEMDVGHQVDTDGSNVLALRVTNPVNIIDNYPVFPEADLTPFDRAIGEMGDGEVPSFAEVPHGKQTWYSSQSGIWQSVSMEQRPVLALGHLLVRPDVSAASAVVEWSLDSVHAPDIPEGTVLKFVVSDPDQRLAAEVNVPAGDSGPIETAIPIADVQLWDIGRPRLYGLVAQLVDGNGTVLDELTTRFGMREIRTENGRILLNGRPIYLSGVLDQDLYPDTISGPSSRALLDTQMRLAQEMGFNLVRCHIKVPDPAYLDAADEAGILLWCELPNWLRFGTASAERGRQTLRAMVKALGNHPSVVIWTIINEDWGTRVRHESRDRRWLRDTYEWLKDLDPTRLVVDNSACETASRPNFHVRTDLADFHVYFSAPDHAERWRGQIEDFARRPPWLWSPHGDAQIAGDEPLILSEFGSWGLPRIQPAADGNDPWWFATGRGQFRPEGWAGRFEAAGLERIWPSLDRLADATQRHQFETLQYEIGELRRHDSIQGYVVTEFCDAGWEANGVLDERREPKVFHHELAAINAPCAVIADLSRRDFTGGERIVADVTLSSYIGRQGRGKLAWWLDVDGSATTPSSSVIDDWPDAGASVIGRLDIEVPEVNAAGEAVLHVRVSDEQGSERAHAAYRVALVPKPGHRGAPLDIAIDDPSGIYQLDRRAHGLGYRLVDADSAGLVVTTELGPRLLASVNRGAHALVLVRSRAAIGPQLELARPVGIHPRWLWHPDWPGDRSPWDGDWVTSWSWIDHRVMPGLPPRNPLGFEYQAVLPDHVLTGYDPSSHGNEVPAGMFAGWIHAPAALIWSFPQGRGWLTVTTLRVAPESGPVADLVFGGLIDLAGRSNAVDPARVAIEIGAGG